MKISEAIQGLQDIKEAAGDLPLAGLLLHWTSPNGFPRSTYLQDSGVDITYDLGDEEVFVTFTYEDF